jgi:hypothetical protein
MILTENNAIQNVGKVLRKECTDYFQIADFIQYCLQLIFYEKTYISGTVHPMVLNVTKEVLQILQNIYYINNIYFELVEDDSKKATELINTVSRALLNEKLDGFADKFKCVTQNDTRNLLGSLPSNAAEFIEKTTDALKKRNIDKLIDEYLSISSFSNDSGFIKILYARSEIIDKLFKVNDIVEWNGAMTYGLIAEVRSMTNRELAILNKQIYFPSIKRGIDDKRKILKQEDYESIIKGWGQVGIIKRYELPSIRQYLINESKGNPKDILKITCDLREIFKPVRKFINKGGKNNQAKQIHVLEEIGYRLFEKKMGQNNKPVIYTSLTSNINLGPLGISKQIENPKEISRERNLSICVEAFTEVIDKMINTNSDSSDYEKELVENCMKN